jgi:ABC-type amino acid transport substrate-binding protein
MRSVWKSDRPPAVRVVTKNVRAHPVAFAGSEGREGFDIAVAQALQSPAGDFGTTIRAGEKGLERLAVSAHEFSRADW